MRARPTLIAALAAAVLSAGCGASQGASTASPRSPSPPSPPPTSASTAPDCVATVLGRMSEAQRVGQLLLLGLGGDQLGPAETDALRAHHVGSVWFTATSLAGSRGIKAVADAVQAEATPAATAGVRFIVAANQEGGQVQALQGPGFSAMPAATQQGGTDVATLGQEASGWGRQLGAAGVNVDFAPVLDVVPPGADAQNEPIGALQREYGHDPATAGSHGTAMLRGLTGAGVAPVVKHFPGLGRVRGNTDFSAGVVDSVTTPTDAYLLSFRAGIDAGAPFVMVALATYTRIDPDHLAVFSPTVMQLLRGDLGFRGVIVSDDLGSAAAVAAIPAGTRAVDFLTAGGDLVIAKTADVAVAMTAAMLSRANGDAGFRSRVDDAAGRVLRAKQALGLLPCRAR